MSKDLIQLLIGAKVRESDIKDIENRIAKIQESIGKIHLDIDTKGIERATTKFKDVQKQVGELSSEKVKVFDESDLRAQNAEFTKITGTIKGSAKYVRDLYKDLGEVTVESQKFSPAMGDVEDSLNSFTVKVKESDAQIKKFKYELAELTDGSQVWLRKGVTGSDKELEKEAQYAKRAHEIRARLAQEEQAWINKSADMREKRNLKSIADANKLAQAQAKASNKALEDNFKMEQVWLNKSADIREARNLKNIAETERLAQTQAKAANKAIEDNYKIEQSEKRKTESLREQIELYQKKNIKDLEIFADKNKGRYDKKHLEDLTSRIRNLSATSGDARREMKEITVEMGHMRKQASEAGNVLSRITENFMKFARFYIVGQAIVSFKQSIGDGIKLAKELDADLTQVSIITGKTREETSELANTYGELAQEMRKTVSEVSQVNTELLRQGLSMDVAADRLDTILKLSSVGDISSEQSLKLITSAVNAMDEESEHTANVILRASQISASSVEDMGNAFTKTASSAKSTGMNITELSAIISGLVEVTQESPNSLGNSVKTLLSRFNKVNEETGEVNKNFNQVQSAFESVGVTFLDSEGQIRPVYELLEDLSGTWETLDKNTKMYISTQAAGVRQQNRFLAVMDNFGRIQEINNELVDTGNTLNQGYATYLNSVEAAANKATASMENMWVNAIDSDAMRDLYLAGSTIFNIIDRIGMLKTAVAALSFGFLLASKRWRSFTNDLLSGGIKGIISQMSALKVGTTTLGNAFTIAGAKALAAKAGIVLLQGAITFGLSAAISLAVGWITRLIGRMSELRDTNDEVIRSFTNNVETNSRNIKRLSELGDEYDSIKSKMDLQRELNEEEKRTLDELIAINPSLLKGYNERGEAIIDTTQNIRDMIEELEYANELEDIELKTQGEGFLEVAKKDIKDTQVEINKLNMRIKEIDEGGLEQTGKYSTKRIESISEMEERLKSIVGLYGEESIQAIELEGDIEALRAKREEYVGLLKLESAKLGSHESDVKLALNAVARQADGYKDLTSEMKGYISEYIKMTNVMDANEFIDMSMAVEEFTRQLSMLDAGNSSDMADVLSTYDELIQQWEDGELTAKELDEAVAEVIATILSIEGIDIDEKWLMKIFGNSSDIDETNKLVRSFISEIDSLGSELEELEKVQVKVNDGYAFSFSEIQNLKKTYPELEGAIYRTADGWKVEEGAIESVRNAMVKHVRAQIKAERELTESTIENAKVRMKARLEEAKALSDMAGVKFEDISIIETERPEKSMDITMGIFDIADINRQNAITRARNEAIKANREIFKAEQDIARLNKAMNELDSLSSGSLSGGGTTKSSSSKAASSKATKSQKEFLDILDAQIRAIQNRNNNLIKTGDLLKEQLEIAKQDDSLAGLNKQHEITGEIIANNKKLLESFKAEQDAVHNMANSLRDEYSQFDIDSWFDGSAEQTPEYVLQHRDATAETQKEMSKVFDWVQKLKQAWMSANDEIKNAVSHSEELESLARRIYELQRDNIYAVYTDSFEGLEHQLAMKEIMLELELSSEKRVDIESDIISLRKSQLNLLERVNKERRNELVLLEQQGLIESERYKTLLKTYQSDQLRILQMQRDIARQKELVADMVIESVKNGYREMLALEKAGVEDRLSEIEKEHDSRIELLDDWLAHHNGIIDEMLEDLNRLEATEDYEDELSKLQEEKSIAERALDTAMGLSDEALDKDARIKDAKKNLAKIDSDINDAMKKRARSLRKEELNDIKKQNENIVSDKKDTENRKLESTRESSEKEIQIIEDKYNRLINNDEMYESIREDIMKGTYTNANKHITRILKSLEKHNADSVFKMGQDWQRLENIILRVVEAQKKLENIEGSQGGVSPGGISQEELDKQIIGKLQRQYMQFFRTESKSVIKREQEKGGYLYELNRQAEEIRNKYGWEYVDYSGLPDPGYSSSGTGATPQEEADKRRIGILQREYMKFVEENTKERVAQEKRVNGLLWELNQQAERIRQRHGWDYEDFGKLSSIPGFSKGGVVDYTGLANVHGSKSSSEVFFSSAQAKKLYDYINFLPSIQAPSNLKVPKPIGGFSKKLGLKGNANDGNTIWNISLNIDKLAGDKNGGKEMFGQFIKEIKLRGGTI